MEIQNSWAAFQVSFHVVFGTAVQDLHPASRDFATNVFPGVVRPIAELFCCL
jgi:hypothetical protein